MKAAFVSLVGMFFRYVPCHSATRNLKSGSLTTEKKEGSVFTSKHSTDILNLIPHEQPRFLHLDWVILFSNHIFREAFKRLSKSCWKTAKK